MYAKESRCLCSGWQEVVVDRDLTDAQTDVLIDVLLDSPDMDVFLQRLVQISSRELGRVLAEAHCSVTVVRNRRPVTVCSSDPETAALDEVQYSSNRGPCMEAASKGQFVEVVDLRTETRWPRYVRAMAGSPMRSVLAVPIPLKTAGGAALNTYSPDPGPVPEDVRKALLELAAVAGRAVTLSVKLQTQAENAADLAAALESRTAIDLASGVIMAQTGCSQEEAVNILMKASSNRNQKLRDVALTVLARFNGAAPTTHFDSIS
jgi:ANTAR domain